MQVVHGAMQTSESQMRLNNQYTYRKSLPGTENASHEAEPSTAVENFHKRI